VTSTRTCFCGAFADSGDLGAIIIKLSDNEDNADPVRIAALPPEQRGVARRYERSMAILRAALTALLAAEPAKEERHG
jgi:hypothetical protein